MRSTTGDADVTAVAAAPFHSKENAVCASPLGSLTAFDSASSAYAVSCVLSHSFFDSDSERLFASGPTCSARPSSTTASSTIARSRRSEPYV